MNEEKKYLDEISAKQLIDSTKEYVQNEIDGIETLGIQYNESESALEFVGGAVNTSSGSSSGGTATGGDSGGGTGEVTVSKPYLIFENVDETGWKLHIIDGESSLTYTPEPPTNGSDNITTVKITVDIADKIGELFESLIDKGETLNCVLVAFGIPVGAFPISFFDAFYMTAFVGGQISNYKFTT